MTRRDDPPHGLPPPGSSAPGNDELDQDAELSDEERALCEELDTLAAALPRDTPSLALDDEALHRRAMARMLAHESLAELEPEPPADEIELQAAAALAARLHEDEWVAALRHAHTPTAVRELRHAALLRDTLAAWRPARTTLWAGAVSGLAAAAALLLWVTFDAPPAQPTTDDTGSWSVSRSTEPLVTGPLAVVGASQRLDRIADARQHDYRDNRFRRWSGR